MSVKNEQSTMFELSIIYSDCCFCFHGTYFLFVCWYGDAGWASTWICMKAGGMSCSKFLEFNACSKGTSSSSESNCHTVNLNHNSGNFRRSIKTACTSSDYVNYNIYIPFLEFEQHLFVRHLEFTFQAVIHFNMLTLTYDQTLWNITWPSASRYI